MLAAALGVASLMSANNTLKLEDTPHKVEKKIKVTMETTCGGSYSEVVDIPDSFTEEDYEGWFNIVNYIDCGEFQDEIDVYYE